MPDRPLVPDWLANPDVVLVRDVATAVIRLDGVERLDSFTLPYPAEAQRALDAMVLACLRTAARPPSGLPELIRWCRTRPLDSWPLDRIPERLFGAEDRLIDAESGEPTQLCHELAVKGVGDSTGRQYDRLVIHEAMRACRDASSPESYTAFRRLLVTRPVLTEAEWSELSNDLFLDPVWFLVEEIYAPAPAGCRKDGAYLCCGRCLTLLTPLVEGGWWCERDQCRYQGAAPHGRLLEAADVGELRQLRRPLRQFVTGPGRAEVDLERELRKLGLAVEMWPGYDAYDLRITFPDSHVWAVDVKDWAHPGFLGSAAEAVRPDPPHDEACWVVPRFRVRTRRDYLDVFAQKRPAHAAGLRLLTDDQLIKAARARLCGERGLGARIAPPATPENGADHA
ncbi:HU-CCDC81 and SPOR domain-containing protein [Streptomyces sparsogenes]|uniref:REase associating with pPIWI RE domain-containing protein n=1 Tax=Streptomyces sparsogenes DSM 40356 TaxID=1331668 RepID=A0A1R1SPS1_9ACTN|nr:HU-CCDC81 and SPOR domain-containing protein [Streptomyces sparsogenes]OMI40253.1 hypothetical protein SPAR_06745 [Streptomyces sparsogenes DSM 40356]